MFDKIQGFYLTLRYNLTSCFIYSFILLFLILILNYLISLYFIIMWQAPVWSNIAQKAPSVFIIMVRLVKKWKTQVEVATDFLQGINFMCEFKEFWAWLVDNVYFSLELIIIKFDYFAILLSSIYSNVSDLSFNFLYLCLYLKDIILDILSFITISNIIKIISWYLIIKLLIKLRIVIKLLKKFLINRIIIFSISFFQYIGDYVFKSKTITALTHKTYKNHNGEIILKIWIKFVSLILNFISNYTCLPMRRSKFLSERIKYYFFIILVYLIIILLLTLYAFAYKLKASILGVSLYSSASGGAATIQGEDIWINIINIINNIPSFHLQLANLPYVGSIINLLFNLPLQFAKRENLILNYNFFDYNSLNVTNYLTASQFINWILLDCQETIWLLIFLFLILLIILYVYFFFKIKNKNKKKGGWTKSVSLNKIIKSFGSHFTWIKWMFSPITSLLLAVIPIVLNSGEIGENILPNESNESNESNDSNESSESDSVDENKGWNTKTKYFKNLTLQDKKVYVQNKIENLGLPSNQFLIDYFISSILLNTSGLKLEVDTFLNKNITTILNDRRAIQLGVNSFVRYHPFLLNNSCESSFSKALPYKSDDAYIFDLQDELESMTEAHKISEYGISNNDNNN